MQTTFQVLVIKLLLRLLKTQHWEAPATACGPSGYEDRKLREAAASFIEGANAPKESD